MSVEKGWDEVWVAVKFQNELGDSWFSPKSL